MIVNSVSGLRLEYDDANVLVAAFVKRLHLSLRTENLEVEQSLSGKGRESRL